MIPIPPFVMPHAPATNITPFTYRDGLTYLQRLERIVKYINVEVTPYINASYGELAGAFETEVNSLIEAVNTALTEQTGEVDQKITDLENMVNFTVNTINTSFNNLEDYVNRTMQDVINDSIQVQDPVVAGMINDENSATNITLSARFAEKGVIPTGTVTSLDVSTIRVTVDPDDEAGVGEVLLFFPAPPRFFVDFGDLSPASGIPDDWSQPWAATSGSWATVDDSGTTILRHTGTGTGRRLLSWDALDEEEKVGATEIVWKWRSSLSASGGGAPRAVIRGAGSGGSETGIACGQQSNGTAGVFRYLSGAPTTLTGAGHAKPGMGMADTWYITRLRADGAQLYVKTWQADDPEPSDWDWEPTDEDAPLTAGKVGLLPFGSGDSDYAWMGVAFRGGKAPMEAI